MDPHYTPADLATFLIQSCRYSSPKRVADFAAGDGALLRAARNRWPEAMLSGGDIDPVAVEHLLAELPGINAQCFDFLAIESSQNCLLQKADVIVLNPPFSCKGGTVLASTVDGICFRSSRALAFVATALTHLADAGELLAILPKSCLRSHRDRALRDYLGKNYGLECIGSRTKEFPGCCVTVELIRLVKGQPAPELFQEARPSILVDVQWSFAVEIMRGCTPVAKARTEPGRYPFVHTSDMNGNTIAVGRSGLSVRKGRVVESVAILIPRVGRPQAGKLVLKDQPEALVISECVIALRTNPTGFEAELFSILRSKWAYVEMLYSGTCAPYITLHDLEVWFSKLGLKCCIVEQMSCGLSAQEHDQRCLHAA